MSQDDLLEKYISNIKKTRWLVTFFIVSFIILTIITLRYANRVLVQEKLLTEQADTLNRQADSLRKKEIQINNLEQANIELEKKIKESAFKNDSVAAVISHKAKKSGDLKSLNELKKLQQEIKETIITLNNNPTVAYIHFNSKKNQTLALGLQQILVEKGFRAPEPEFVKDRYKSSIRYFHQEDEEKAYEVLRVFKENDNLFRTNPKLEKMDMSAPSNQIEIWISE